jgi:hypothetical protein
VDDGIVDHASSSDGLLRASPAWDCLDANRQGWKSDHRSVALEILSSTSRNQPLEKASADGTPGDLLTGPDVNVGKERGKRLVG